MSARDFLLAIASGLLLVLTFPRFDLEPLAWVALVPLLWALLGKSPKESFWLGGLTGLIFYGGVIYWVINTMVHYGHLPFGLSLLILLLLVVYMGAYVALFAAFLGFLGGVAPRFRWLGAPLIWTTLELVRAHLFTGFPWATLGYSQYQTLSLIQISDITGVYGVSFLIVWVNTTLVTGIELLRRRALGGAPLSPRRPSLSLALRASLPLLALFLCLEYGHWRISRWAPAVFDENLSRVRTAIIQGNIEQDKKWDPVYQEEVFLTYRDLSLKASQLPVDLMVWPEAATPFYFQSDENYRQQMVELVVQSRSYLLFGSPAYDLYGDQVRLFNRAYLLSPQGEVLAQYDKIHLVPFGEYVPLHPFLPFVNKMVEAIGDFDSGREYTVMSTPMGKFSVLICFEAIFPRLARRFVKEGAEFLINITNDAWFGRSAAPYQHLSMIPFRAIENRVPIIRAANTGISALIDPVGRIASSSDIFVNTWISGEVRPKRKGMTFYTRYGDLFAYLCALSTAILLLKPKT